MKWATCNVGASRPEDFGGHYAWGETKEKRNYIKDTYFDSNYDKYSKNKKTILDPEDDVAHVKWGGNWRMPTIQEQDDLRTKCSWVWTSQNGVNGYVVTGPNGNSIFLPAAGGYYASNHKYAGTSGRYWSSSLLEDYDDSYAAYYLHCSSEVVSWYGQSRFSGHSVRPVCP